MYRAHLVKKGLSSRTIATHITGVRSRLRLDGVDLKENQYLMKQMHRSAKKQDAHRLRCPVTKILLHQIMKRLDLVTQNNYEAAMFGALFALAYHGLFRVGELVESEHALHAENMLQAKNGSLIHCFQHSSKVMMEGSFPALVEIAPDPDSEFCPCAMVEHFTAARAEAKRFWARVPRQFFVHRTGVKVTKAQVLNTLWKCVNLIPDFEAQEFGTHSFRSGKASDMFRAGKSDQEIMTAGRWTSSVFKRYIKV